MAVKYQFYSPESSAALAYICDFIFKEYFKIELEEINDKAILNHELPIINYSNEFIEGSLQIAPIDYLFREELKDFPEIIISKWEELPCFFQSENGNIPFDLLAGTFFFLSRAEEYGGQTDAHGRFPSENSVFAGTEIINRPLVDEWLIKFAGILRSKFSQFNYTPGSYSWINTFDIDVAYAHKYRTPYRWLGASAKDIVKLRFGNFINRLAVTLNLAKDNFDTYQFQREIIKKYKVSSKYFFLLGDYGQYDKNLSHKNKGLQKLIKSLDEIAEVGIHPSYNSHKHIGILQKEIDRLKLILKRKVQISRQHYLKFTMPASYRNLISVGITEDYSMGYADTIGFRSGTCTAHYFFDIERKESSGIKIIPLIAMDSSLRDYMKLTPEEGIEKLRELIKKVRAVNGTFVSLWHNETLGDKDYWRGWKKVYMEMAAIAGKS